MNTDAEGENILADLYEYAQDKIKDIDYIFDYATLTGSVYFCNWTIFSRILGIIVN